MPEHTGGDAVVDVLERAGVEVIFGIPSVHNLPVYDALARRGRIRAVTVRHEQAATGAADGYARATGSIGVALTSTGPGAANAMGGLLEAYVSGSPVVHLTGQIETRFLDSGRGFIHEVPDQPAMLDALSKRVLRAVSADDIAAVVAEAVGTALEWPRGPVSVELPIDLQYADAVGESSSLLDRLLTPEPCRAPDPAEIRQAVELLSAARRPLVWVGGGAVASGAAEEVRELSRRLGAGVITSPNGRGLLPESDALCIGNLSWDPDVRQLCAEADVLIGIGTRYQGPNTENWKMRLPERIVQVDVDPDRPGCNYAAAVQARGDARQVLEALLAQLPVESGTEASWPSRVSEVVTAARARLRATLGPQVRLLDATERVLPAGTVVVKDSTIPAYTWGNRLLEVTRPRTAIMPNGFAIGLGLPQLVGAAAAALSSGPAPAVLMVGDGGVAQSLGELATLAAEGLAAVVLCFSDGGYGILRNIQHRQYGRTIGVDLGRPDLAGAASALGVPAVKVTSVEQYEAELSEAVARRGPSFIEIDLESIGPMARPYTGTSKPPLPH
jgi:acetolactate synthase-1/2/3 large subunit